MVAGVVEAARAEASHQRIALRLRAEIHGAVGAEDLVEETEMRRDRLGHPSVGRGGEHQATPVRPLLPQPLDHLGAVRQR